MATGTRYSYTDTGITKRGIADVVNMIDWTEAPLLRIFGFSSSNLKKFKLVNWPTTKVELVEDTMAPYTTTLNGSHNSSVTTIAVASNTGAYFRQGDIILIDTEQMLVTSVSSDNLTVATRPYGSTSAASHSTLATVTITTRAMPEGADYTTGYTTTTTQPSNYSQIISEAVKVSKTDLAITKYGIDEEMDYQVGKLFADGGQSGRLAQLLQRTFYYGQPVQRSTSAYGSMGGFKSFVTTNVTNLSGAAITRDAIHTKVRQIRDAGGKVSHLVCGSWGLEKINAMYEGAIETTRDETIGGSEINTILTPHGRIKIVYDWMCLPADYYFVNTDKIGWLPVRDFDRGKVAEQGDYHVSDVVGEYTFLVANEKSHGYITGASTTS
jgi:hypothetical protein